MTVALDPHVRTPFPSLVEELPLTRSALEFATAHHEGQRRDADSAPFILHPLEVAQLLRGRAYPDEVVAAGVLHDVVEDTGVERAELAIGRGGGALAPPAGNEVAPGRVPAPQVRTHAGEPSPGAERQAVDEADGQRHARQGPQVERDEAAGAMEFGR